MSSLVSNRRWNKRRILHGVMALKQGDEQIHVWWSHSLFDRQRESADALLVFCGVLLEKFLVSKRSPMFVTLFEGIQNSHSIHDANTAEHRSTRVFKARGHTI